MASFESSDPQRSGAKPESSVWRIPLSSELDVDWSMFDLLLKQNVFQWPNGVLCLTTDFDKLDLAKIRQPKTKKQDKRNLDLLIPKSWGLSLIYIFNYNEAKAVLIAHHQSNPTGNAFKFYNLLKVRLSRKNEDRLQGMINDLLRKPGKSQPHSSIGWKKVLPLQPLTARSFLRKFAMVGVLKKAVQIRFKTLTAGIKLVNHDWTLPLLQTKFRKWKIVNEIITPQPPMDKYTLHQPGEDETPVLSRIETSRAI